MPRIAVFGVFAFCLYPLDMIHGNKTKTMIYMYIPYLRLKAWLDLPSLKVCSAIVKTNVFHVKSVNIENKYELLIIVDLK